MATHAKMNPITSKSHRHTIKLIAVGDINGEISGGIHDTKF